jgi:hypothetical protein
MSGTEARRFAEAFWCAIRPVVDAASQNEHVMLEVGQQLRTVVAYLSVHASAVPQTSPPTLASATCEGMVYERERESVCVCVCVRVRVSESE